MPRRGLLAGGPEGHPACGRDPVVPNHLHKVWLSYACPSLLDYVSLIASAILLGPDRITYHRSAGAPASCNWTAGGASGSMDACWTGLGVRHSFINVTGVGQQGAAG